MSGVSLGSGLGSVLCGQRLFKFVNMPVSQAFLEHLGRSWSENPAMPAAPAHSGSSLAELQAGMLTSTRAGPCLQVKTLCGRTPGLFCSL